MFPLLASCEIFNAPLSTTKPTPSEQTSPSPVLCKRGCLWQCDVLASCTRGYLFMGQLWSEQAGRQGVSLGRQLVPSVCLGEEVLWRVASIVWGWGKRVRPNPMEMW